MSAKGEACSSHNDLNGFKPNNSNPAPINVVKLRKSNTVRPTNSVLGDLKTVFVYIPFNFVGIIIGLRGKNLRRIANYSGAFLKFYGNIRNCPVVPVHNFGTEGWNKLKIMGSYVTIKNAQHIIFSHIYLNLFGTDLSTYENFKLIIEIFVESHMTSHIIGRNGWKVQRLELTTGSKIIVPQPNKNKSCNNNTTSVFIIGDFMSTQLAQKKIHWLMRGNI